MNMEKQEFRCKMCGQAFPSNEELDMHSRQAHPKAVSGQQKEWRSDPGQARHAPGRDRPGQDSPMKVGMKEGTSEGQATDMPRPGNTQTWDPRRADSMGNNHGTRRIGRGRRTHTEAWKQTRARVRRRTSQRKSSPSSSLPLYLGPYARLHSFISTAPK